MYLPTCLLNFKIERIQTCLSKLLTLIENFRHDDFWLGHLTNETWLIGWHFCINLKKNSFKIDPLGTYPNFQLSLFETIKEQLSYKD